MKYLIYCRKSSEDERKQAQSIETQLNILNDFVTRNNLNVIDNFIEEKSAAEDGKRPKFDDMLKRIINNEADAILVAHIDRLSRNGIESGNLTKLFTTGFIKEIRTLVKTYNTIQDILLIEIEFAIAAHYSRNLSERTKEGITNKLTKGEYPGCGPIGYVNRKGRIYSDPKKSSLIQQSFEMYASGQYSLRQISDYFYSQGLRTRCGCKVHKSQFNMIFRRPCYYGAILCKGILYKGIHKPLVSKQLFDIVNDVLDGKNHSKRQKHDFLYSGYLNCAVCGCMMTASLAKGKYIYYYCTNGKKICNQRNDYLREKEANDLVQKIMDDFIIDKEMADQSLKIYMDSLKNSEVDNVTTKQRLKQQLADIDKRLDKLLDLLLKEAIDETTYKKKQQGLKDERVSLEEALSNSKTDDLDTTFELLSELKNRACNLGEMYKIDDFSVRKDLLLSVLSNLKIKDKNISSEQYKLPYAIFKKVGKNADISEWLALGNTFRTYEWLKPYQPIDLTFSTIQIIMQGKEVNYLHYV